MTKKNKIKIKVNGKYFFVNNGSSVKQLLNFLKISYKKVAIELNREILDKSKIHKILLKNKDKIEIVHFIGGG